MSVIYINSYQFAVAAPPDGYDSDAQSYITAVEAADGQALETAVKAAINVFVVGCKTDGIWNAIKASCILAGARTLSGALVPLKGAAPTNNNFVSGDYNRKTGLVGDGSTKYLDSNRNNNADPQNDRHIAIYSTSADTTRNYARYLAAGDSAQGDTYIVGGNSPSPLVLMVACASGNFTLTAPDTTTGFIGISRGSASSFAARAASSNSTLASASITPRNENLRVFGRPGEIPTRYVNARLSFYSIGESLDLALLDTRVSTLMTDIGAAIP